MGAVQNVLFIMADQLRADHLGCYGHPYLETPSLDGLAARALHARLRQFRGVRSVAHELLHRPLSIAPRRDRNRVPLSVNEITLGEYPGQGRDRRWPARPT